MTFRASWTLAIAPAPTLPAGGIGYPQLQSGGISQSTTGIDISALPDLAFTLKGGLANLGEALCRRLQTPRGQLFYNPDYGLDLRERINDSFSNVSEIAALTHDVEFECEKDNRIIECNATAEIDDGTLLAINIFGTSTLGPFDFVLGIDAITGVSLLTNQGT